MQIVGVYGCTCSGKSTFAQSLVDAYPPSRILEADAYRWPEAEYAQRGVPQLDLSTLPWKFTRESGENGSRSYEIPAALDKKFDTNCPAWIDWEGACKVL